jgi:hypothetical protein
MKNAAVIILALIMAMNTPLHASAKSLGEFSFLDIKSSDNISAVKDKLDIAHDRGNLTCSIEKAAKTCKEDGCLDNFCRIGDVNVMVFQVTFEDEKLISISAQTRGSMAPLFIDALKSRYGKPNKTLTEKMQNGYGAVFNDTTYSWSFKDGIMNFVYLGNPANSGGMMNFTTNEHLNKFKGKKKAKDAM